MKLILGFMVLFGISSIAFTCNGVEVDSCEAVVNPSEEKCRLRYEVLFEMSGHSDQPGGRFLRGKQCGYSGFHCVRMGHLCMKYHN
jgi:hypothetical protein